jgi:glyoxylase-like metal-dependent hydrolase (beta-lactamase superfamily II)
MPVSRRTLIAAGAAALAMPALPGASGSAHAAAPMLGTQAPGFFRWKVGTFEVTALHDGVVRGPVEQGRIPNAPLDEVKKLLAANFMSTEVATNHFTTLVVNTGSKLILIDSGFNNNGAPTTGQMAVNMAAAGIDPKQIDTVLISHFHPDHINGLRTKEGALVYANAEIAIPQADFDHYMDDAKMNAVPEAARGGFLVSRRVFGPIAKDLRRMEMGKEAAPGITAMASPGHTPGHTSFVVSSGTATLLVVGDASNDPRVFARNPHWHLGFDLDKPLAVESRRKLLDMAATDRMQLSFYHAAFPATGYVAKDGAGFNWFPASYAPV